MHYKYLRNRCLNVYSAMFGSHRETVDRFIYALNRINIYETFVSLLEQDVNDKLPDDKREMIAYVMKYHERQ